MMSMKFLRFAKHGLLMSETVSNKGISSILIMQAAKFHAIEFSKDIKLHSNEKLIRKENTLKVLSVANSDRPLMLLYVWMLAKDKHITKYVDLYKNMGFDVLSVRLPLMDFLRPVKGSQVSSDVVLDFLHQNYQMNPLLVHGFSVGAYAFGELVVKMLDDREAHKDIHNRFVGQIWDSAVDVCGLPEGVSKAITKNVVLQKSIEKYLIWFLKMNYETTTKHYNKASSMIHQNTLNVPGLFIFSNNDPVAPPEMSKRASANWKEVYYKCFEDSLHVSHYHKYRSDYEAEVLSFWERVNLFKMTKGRAVVL